MSKGQPVVVWTVIAGLSRKDARITRQPVAIGFRHSSISHSNQPILVAFQATCRLGEPPRSHRRWVGPCGGAIAAVVGPEFLGRAAQKTRFLWTEHAHSLDLSKMSDLADSRLLQHVMLLQQ